MSERIKIVKIAVKQNPSKYKPGETYAVVTVMDDKNRKLSAMGRWAENWKVGDVIEANVEERKWTDRDGFEQTGLSLKNPTPSTFGNKGFTKNTLIDAYHIAAELASVIYASKKKITMKDIDELATYIKSKLDTGTSTPAPTPAPTPAVPTVDVNTPAPAPTPVASEDDGIEIEDADDDKPF